MVGVPQSFRKTDPSIVASYDFTDVLSGKAYEILYAGKTISGATGFLRSFAFNSPNIAECAWSRFFNETGASWVKKLDLDFDIKSGKNVTTDGEAIITGGMGFYQTGAVVTYKTFVEANIIKWDGTSETFLASGASTLIEGVTPNDIRHERIWAINVDIPKTTFKKDESIRLNCKVFATSGSSVNQQAFVHDPANKTMSGAHMDESQLILYMPFKIQT